LPSTKKRIDVMKGRYSNYAKAANAIARIYGSVLLVGDRKYKEKAIRVALILWSRYGLKVKSMRYTRRGRRVRIYMAYIGKPEDHIIIR